jgi:hypothetical protein
VSAETAKTVADIMAQFALNVATVACERVLD